MRKLILCLLLLPALLLSACAQPDAPPPPEQQPLPPLITVQGDAVPGGEAIVSLGALYAAAPYAAVYSTINNWPSKRAYVASGVLVADILAAAGVEEYGLITFAGPDGYQHSLTYRQLNQERWHYPGLLEDDPTGAVAVEPIIALEYYEDSWDMADLRGDRPLLVIGMSNFYEHTNPLFISGLDLITVSRAEAGQWPPPGIYPEQGPYRLGDTVKLQHESFGLVKIHYTLDGSDPTAESAMYNPSNYQPELNAPFTVEGGMLIKARAIGYGKRDSEISVFEIKPE